MPLLRRSAVNIPVAGVTDPVLRQELAQLLILRQSQRASALLINRVGRSLKPQSVRLNLRRIATEIGMKKELHPTWLRHTAATLLIETGVDIRLVHRLLGHSSIATTEIYTHVTDEALRVTLERANVLETLVS